MKVSQKNSECNTKRLKESCQPCISLIPETFSRLKLKDKQFEVYKPSTHDEIYQLFARSIICIDETLKSDDTMADLLKPQSWLNI